MKDEELIKIIKAAYKWDLYAALSPIVFLLIIGLSIYLGFVKDDIAFYVGVFIFCVTSVLWWIWTIITIRKLAITLIKVSDNLTWVKSEFKKIRENIADIQNNNE
jgi:hypothetical protein